jgi:hypothetical protein
VRNENHSPETLNHRLVIDDPVDEPELKLWKSLTLTTTMQSSWRKAYLCPSATSFRMMVVFTPLATKTLPSIDLPSFETGLNVVRLGVARAAVDEPVELKK